MVGQQLFVYTKKAVAQYKFIRTRSKTNKQTQALEDKFKNAGNDIKADENNQDSGNEEEAEEFEVADNTVTQELTKVKHIDDENIIRCEVALNPANERILIVVTDKSVTTYLSNDRMDLLQVLESAAETS